MNGVKQLISDGINRILGDGVKRKALDAFEGGHWPRDLWKLVVDNGFQRILEEDGKPADDWQNAEPVLFALGYHRAPLPLAETVLANWLCAKAGLPVTDDPATVIDAAASNVRLYFNSDGASKLLLSGTAHRVPWASACERLLVCAMLDGRPVLAALPAKAAGITIETGRNLASEPRDTVHFLNCAVRPVELDLGLGVSRAQFVIARPVELYGALARAVCMAGAATSVLDQSVQYVKDRIAFGRPLARFQAIQHMLAEMGSETAAATMAAASACVAAGGARAGLEIAVAKVRAGQMATSVSRIGHQVHGAIGFTQEYSLQLGTRRLWSWRQEFGSDAEWAQQIGQAAIAAGGNGLWIDIMVGREFPSMEEGA
jgi:acyl-CoA dehydrogenase